VTQPSRRRNTAALFFGFVLTGTGTALLGCLLPALSELWHLPDDRAGALFAAQFLGASLGALLVGKDVRRSLYHGYLLLFASAVALAYLASVPLILRFLCFGLGLGLTMTATSLLIGSVYREKRGQALSVLNAFWTAGAALGPVLASLWEHKWPPTSLFLLVGALTLCPLFLLGSARESHLEGTPGEEPLRTNAVTWIVLFATLGFFYVGVEASVGSWLMTYVHRLPEVNLAWAPIVTSCFWIAILIGRLLAPIALTHASERTVLSAGIFVALLSTISLVANQSPLLIACSTVVAGIALGPIYPLCLSQAMRALSDSQRTKWVFAFPGFGATLFPYLTGFVSTNKGSLRTGLLVPVIALVAMVGLDRLQPSIEVDTEKQISERG
jgi:MFS transporter, FHS family, glucose/mannose:H+ symporter